jgi:hypothetical protein
MLQVTAEATHHLLRLRQERGFGPAAVPRFARGGGGRVGLTFVSGPEPGDRVVEGPQIPVYVAADISDALESSVIDARSEDGRIALVLRPLGTESAAEGEER